ncbi:dNA protecting protein DprA [Clostridium sp. CAG:354]|jgi:DNA processing protein|nr:DNA-processing protein DprA [Clostridium sp.]MBS5864544.1 DNA-processing protein DprA [Clostridium sp.]MEE0268804.1 DNA-processing protein DprA [Clostridia bacterium]CDE10602.1 dNA protecting protein DprA [Clostridium sp. CAG:354]
MTYKELVNWIMLAEYKKITNKKKIELLHTYKNINEICSIFNLNQEEKIDKYIKYMQEKNIQIISYYDKTYPQQLKNLYDAPIVIYAIGNCRILNSKNKIAVIGARKASNYGINIARQIGIFLSKNNIHTISGLALGIDVNSHLGVLKENSLNSASGRAIAVIGNGLDNIYPYQNKEIAEKIINSGGCIISEYIIGTKPLKNNFPARNRIISALADKLIVVEAENEKSGTMITVDFSLELGKEIYVVPGNINSKMSVGTNKLIKDGAKIITEFNDIIDEDY